MITQYHRPATIEEALALVGTPGAYVIAEGTSLNSTSHPNATAVIDLQSLDLDVIEISGGAVRVGSMATLTDLSSSPLIPPVIADLAKREAPSTIRNAATIGGVIATNDPESELLAGLVAVGASVAIARANTAHQMPIETALENPQIIESAVMIDISIDPRGVSAAHRTGRTPMDRPIVMVVGHKGADGRVRLAVTGVASHVIAVSPGEVDALDPPSDFRGTTRYRKELATVLTKRVLADLSEGER